METPYITLALMLAACSPAPAGNVQAIVLSAANAKAHHRTIERNRGEGRAG